MILRRDEGCGRYSRLYFNTRISPLYISLKDARLDNEPFDLFRPNPSLSTTSSAHCILRRALGAGPVARRRSTGVEVCVWVCVAVVEVVEDVEAREGWVGGAGAICVT